MFACLVSVHATTHQTGRQIVCGMRCEYVMFNSCDWYLGCLVLEIWQMLPCVHCLTRKTNLFLMSVWTIKSLWKKLYYSNYLSLVLSQQGSQLLPHSLMRFLLTQEIKCKFILEYQWPAKIDEDTASKYRSVHSLLAIIQSIIRIDETTQSRLHYLSSSNQDQIAAHRTLIWILW